MKSNVFKTFWIGCKSFWSFSPIMTVSVVIQLSLAVFLLITALPRPDRTPEQLSNRLSLGLAIGSMALAQLTLLGNLSHESNKLNYESKKLEYEFKKEEAEQSEFVLTQLKIEEIMKKLNNIEDYLIKKKKK